MKTKVFGYYFPNRFYYFLSKHQEHFLQLSLLFVLTSTSLLAYATFYGL